MSPLLPDGERVVVKVFGGVVVLRGTVNDLATIRRVETIASHDASTVRVINKLAVG